MAEDDVKVKFGADDSSLKDEVGNIGEALEGLKHHAEGLGDLFKEAAAAFGLAFSVDKLIEFTEGMAQLGEQTVRTSEIFGITTEEVGFLGFAARATGGDAHSLIRSLERMSTSLVDVSGKATPTGAALKALGLNVKDLQGLPLPEFLDKVRDRFSQLPDDMRRTAIAQNLTRQGAENLLPILRMNSDEWENLRRTFDATGAGMDERRATTFAGMEHSINTMQTAVLGLGERIMDVFAPAITVAIDNVTKFIESLDGNAVQAAVNGLLTGAFQLVDAVLEIVIRAEGAVEGLIIRMGGLANAAQGLANITTGIGTMNPAEIISGGMQLAGKNVDAELAALDARVAKGLAATKSTMAAWSVSVRGLISGGVKNAMGGPDDRSNPGGNVVGDTTPTKTFGDLNLGGGNAGADATAAARSSIEAQLALLRAGLAQKKQLLDGDLASGKLNAQSYAQAMIDATDSEYEAERQLVEKEASLDGLKLAQRQQLLGKLKIMEQQHATEITKIQQAAAEAARKAWQQPLDALTSAITSQVGALVNGTESIGQAMLNIGANFATEIISQAIKAIVALGAQAFAGVFAHDAPTLGLGAAGTAAAASAAVAGAAAGLSSLDVGTWGLPRDMPIQAHRGETIIPRFESEMFRSAMENMAKGGGGGKSEVHNHFNGGIVWDRESVARAIAQTFDANPSIRPKG